MRYRYFAYYMPADRIFERASDVARTPACPDGRDARGVPISLQAALEGWNAGWRRGQSPWFYAATEEECFAQAARVAEVQGG